MITEALIKQNGILSSLTPEQISAITTLSQQDEATVIAEKTREIYGGLDNDVTSVSGVQKGNSEKTYDYIKRVVTEFKEKAGSVDAINTNLQKLQTEKTDLEKQLKSGNIDEATKTRIADLEKKIADKETSIKEWKDKYNADISAKVKEVEEANKSILGVQIDNQFTQAVSGLTFKKEEFIPKEVRESFIKEAKQSLLGEYTPDFIDDGKGGKLMVFRNKEGLVANNPENQLLPFTAAELLSKKLTPIIDTGRKANGAGSKAPEGKGANSVFTVNAKNQVEADSQIEKYLVGAGENKMDPKFHEKALAIRNENNVSELPLQ